MGDAAKIEFLRGKARIGCVGIVQKVKKVKKSARLKKYSINTLASQRVGARPTLGTRGISLKVLIPFHMENTAQQKVRSYST